MEEEFFFLDQDHSSLCQQTLALIDYAKDLFLNKQHMSSEDIHPALSSLVERFDSIVKLWEGNSEVYGFLTQLRGLLTQHDTTELEREVLLQVVLKLKELVQGRVDQQGKTAAGEDIASVLMGLSI